MASDIPPEAYLKAAEAYCLDRFDYSPSFYADPEEGPHQHFDRDAADAAKEVWLIAMVAAVWPLAEAKVRASVAAEIRAADVQRIAHLEGDTARVGLTVAARIAEGKQ